MDSQVNDVDAIEEAVRQFAKYANSNLLKQDELVYLHTHLKPLVEKTKIDKRSQYIFL